MNLVRLAMVTHQLTVCPVTKSELMWMVNVCFVIQHVTLVAVLRTQTVSLAQATAPTTTDSVKLALTRALHVRAKMKMTVYPAMQVGVL